MEADWQIEIGGNAPVIEACWSGFADLRRTPERAIELTETLLLPRLASTLVQINSAESQLFTTKCDVWPVTEIDPFEFDAPQKSAAHGLAAYVDLLPHDPQTWSDPDKAIGWCKKLCAALQATPLRCCRADLVIRQAIRMPDEVAIGITAYLAACGSTAEAAIAQLEAVLAVFADSIAAAEPRNTAHSKLQ